MNEPAPLICPICNHIRLMVCRVCRVCMGLDDEAGNPLHDERLTIRPVIQESLIAEPIPKPRRKRSHKKHPLPAGADSKSNHIQVKICPFCRSLLAPWQSGTCGKVECEQKAVSVALMRGEKKHCRRCGYPWPDTDEFYYPTPRRNDHRDPVCKECRREEARQRAKNPGRESEEGKGRMATIDELRKDLKATIMKCCLHESSSGLDHQADAIMRMLDGKYFSLAQMEAEAEGILGPK